VLIAGKLGSAIRIQTPTFGLHHSMPEMIASRFTEKPCSTIAVEGSALMVTDRPNFSATPHGVRDIDDNRPLQPHRAH
jgi:hypothetical protein